jgi:hypothetical protein
VKLILGKNVVRIISIMAQVFVDVCVNPKSFRWLTSTAPVFGTKDDMSPCPGGIILDYSHRHHVPLSIEQLHALFFLSLRG